jgi:hypothetical protein
MSRLASLIGAAAAALIMTAAFALAESPYGFHDYWSRVEAAQECAWHGGYAWDSPEYPCWNYGPRAAYAPPGSAYYPPAGYYPPPPAFYGSSPPPGYGYRNPYYGYGWR